MHLPKFKHLRPASFEEAAKILNEYNQGALIVAGGTDLLVRMKYGLDRPEVLVSLKGLKVRAPVLTPEGLLVVDPLMNMAAVTRSPEVQAKAPLLAEAALAIGSNEIRNMGTIGGNLCLETRCLYYNQSHSFQFVESCFKRDGDKCYFIPKGDKCWAIFMADTVPALICLGAEVKIMGCDRVRQIPLEGLYTGDGKRPLALSPSEILVEIVIPSTPSKRGSAFAKFGLRGGIEFAAISVAALLDMKDDAATCAQARIAVGAVAAAPVRARQAEMALAGKRLSNHLFEEVGQVAAEEIRPVSHHGYSASYLKECLKIQTQRVLTKAAKRINGE